MAYNKFIRALLRDETIPIYGDGLHVRGNTFIDDCVRATIAAMQALPRETFNIGGGETATVWDIIHKLEQLAGKPARIKQEAPRPGDQRYTFADTTKLRQHLGWEPRVTLDEGLARQWAWQKSEPG